MTRSIIFYVDCNTYNIQVLLSVETRMVILLKSRVPFLEVSILASTWVSFGLMQTIWL